jgi:hypothetical protein
MKIVNVSFSSTICHGSSLVIFDGFYFHIHEVSKIDYNNNLIRCKEFIDFYLNSINRKDFLFWESESGTIYIEGTLNIIYCGQTKQYLKDIIIKYLKGTVKND